VIAQAMNDVEADELRYALGSPPDLRFLLGDTAVIRRTAIHNMVSARGRQLGIYLIAETADADVIEIMPRQDAEAILREAMTLAEQPNAVCERQDASRSGLARFFNRQDVILMGPRAFFQRPPTNQSCR
jgi:hypothetical protein